jgi:hypothetical protein
MAVALERMLQSVARRKHPWRSEKRFTIKTTPAANDFNTPAISHFSELKKSKRVAETS